MHTVIVMAAAAAVSYVLTCGNVLIEPLYKFSTAASLSAKSHVSDLSEQFLNGISSQYTLLLSHN